MRFMTIFAVVSSAIAAPWNGGSTCSNGGTQQCCNSLQSSDAILGALLGIPVGIPIGIGCVPLLDSCGGQAACCTGNNQVGLVNVGLNCVPISL